jgi:hypothetical protein
MSRILFFICLLFSFSCTKTVVTEPLCKLAFSTITGAAQGVADSLGCKNVAAIAGDISAPLVKNNLCPAPGQQTQQGMIGDLVCGQVIDSVVKMGFQNLPATWQCSGTSTDIDGWKSAALTACKAHITF